jgi:two-component system, NarL family, response regulator DesR
MIRVLLAEDSDLFRTALAALLRTEVDLEVVGQVARGDEVVAACARLKPDVAVIDVDMPGIDGLEAASVLAAEQPSVKVVVLTSIGRPVVIRRALAQKVQGFLLKDAPADALTNAIRTVATGGRFVSSELALTAWDMAENPLTPREVEVLRRAADGAAVAEIAGSLYLSSGTVRNYLGTAISKLNARSRVDAIRIAQDSGWL